MPRVINSLKKGTIAKKGPEYLEETEATNVQTSTSPLTSWRPNKTFYLILGLALLISFFILKKNWFVAATVNGTPISNFELLNRLNAQYRSQTLGQMINEQLILEEAKKNNLTVSASDIDQKISQLEKNVGGAETLDSLLSQQGQTRNSLKSQLRLQIMVEKLYSNEASVSAQEVEDFISQNGSQLQATESAAQIQEAAEILKQQKISSAFGEKFPQLKQAAKIQIF